MNNKVSVIIPTYHGDETLLRAVDSVLSQTYSDSEIIVVDDNDPSSSFRSHTEQMMEKYRDNTRVRYLKHERNKNGSAARNTGFRASTGEFLVFLDDDDFFYPQKLEKQVEYMLQRPDLMGTYCWRVQHGREIKGKYNGDLTQQILTLEFTPCTDALMIRRAAFVALNGFDESYRRHQDFEFLLRYFEKFTLEYVPSVQLEISTNGVNNVPRGQKLVDLKEQFFKQFQSKIDSIWAADPEKGQAIYRNHFVPTFKDLIRDHEFALAKYVYQTYHPKCGKGFWSLFMRQCLKGRIGKLKKLLH